MIFDLKLKPVISAAHLLVAVPLVLAACSKPSTSDGTSTPASSVAAASVPVAVSAPATSPSPVGTVASATSVPANAAGDDADAHEADESGVAVGTVIAGDPGGGSTAETPFGKLSANGDNVLLLDGKPVNPRIEGNNSLSFVAQVALKNRRAVLVEDNGGSACPATYRWVILSEGSYTISPEFGSCSDLAKVSTTAGNLVVTMPGFVGDTASPAEQKRAAGSRMSYLYDGKTVTEKTAAAEQAQPDTWHRGPRIKGIQLGDSMDDVRREVKGLWPDGQCELRTVNETIHPFYCGGVFMAGTEFNSGRLSNLYVTPLLSEHLFGNMRVKDFVQNFASAYGVPSMEAQTGPTGRDYLLYRDDSGWEVTIFDDNSFDVKAVATPGEQTKSFN